jgi:hypothetical protein
LKIEIGRTTVANILAEEGIEPAPEREKKRTWKRFMKSHWDTLFACDFFRVEVLGIPAQNPKCNLYDYMTERFHQGIGGELIRNVGPMNDNGADGEVACRSRLGGMLN